MIIGMGPRIKATRKTQGITGEHLAELCHLNATYLRQIEAARKIPSLPVFICLCNTLQVSPTYLLTDSITQNELSDFAELAALWKSATPQQIELVTAMLRSAFTYLNT